MPKDEVMRFSVSLPKKLFDELDDRVKRQGYASRSEYTRDLIRERIVQEKWSDSNEEVIGVLTMIYSHHHNNLVERILSIQHDAKIDIMCNTHIHVDHDNCLETIMLKGISTEVKKFADQIAGLKGVRYSKLVEAAIPN